MTLRFPILLVFLAAGLFAQPSQAYVARNGMQVIQQADGTMFVPFKGLSGDTNFWCAVGDYVTNVLRRPGGTRIFRMSEPPRPAGQGILFSLSGEGAASGTGVTVFGAGPEGSISAGMAFAFCPRRPRFFLGFGLPGI